MRKRFIATLTAAALVAGAGTAAALTHTVQSGDSLSRIATQYSVPGGWPALYEANRSVVGDNPNALQVGQVLSIPGVEDPAPLPIPGTGVYRGPGETAKVDGFGSWLGGSVQATDYVDPSENATWNPVVFKRWGDWKKAEAGRKFVLGLPLLPKNGVYWRGLGGQYDAQFRGVAQLLVANGLGDSVVRLGYEPNNPNIGPWQATSNPEAYKQMFRRVHGIMKKVAPNLKFDYNLAVGTSGRVTSWWSLYPGSAYVDIIGLNIYDVWWAHYSATPAQRWNHTLTKAIGVNDHKAFARYVGKPVSYPEWGLYKRGDSYAGGGDSTYFIDRMAELTKSARYNAYFDLNWTSYGSSIDMFPNARAQYKKKFGAP